MFVDHLFSWRRISTTEDVNKDEAEAQRRQEKHRLYLREAFFVDVIHHDNFIVKYSTGPSRARLEPGRREK